MDDIPGRFPPPPDAPPPPPGMAGAIQGYPLNFERILQLTFSLYRFAWLQFVAVGLVLLFPLAIAANLLQVAAANDLLRAQQAQLDYITGRPVAMSELLPLSWLLVSFVTIFLIGAAGYVAQGGLIDLTAAVYGGKPPSARASIRAALSRLLTLVGAGLLVLLTTMGLTLAGVAAGIALIAANMSNGSLQPGLLVFVGLVVVVATLAVLIFVSIRLAFVSQAVMLESRGAIESVGRSWRLIAGSSLRVLGYAIAFGLLTGLIGLVIGAVVELVFGSGISLAGGSLVFDPVRYLLSGLISSFVSIALMPIGIIAMTLLFFDIRFRREAAAT